MAAYKYFKNTFAVGGDKTAVPETSPPDGSVSYTTGFGSNYSGNLKTDPNALAIPRDQFNEIIYDLTLTLQEYQQFGIPNFITTAQNGGTAFSYSRYAVALYDDGSHGLRPYESSVNSNTALPTDTSKWRLLDGFTRGAALTNVTFNTGVVDGDVVYYDHTNFWYAKALLNNTEQQWVAGVADVANKRVLINGQISLFTGLTSGLLYYLSSDTPGAVTSTIPAATILNPVAVGVSTSSTTINFNVQTGYNSPYTVPVGTIFDFAGGALPDGFLLTDGAAVSRTTYADLFGVIGTVWGVGDGSTTFNVPDIQGRATIGSGTGAGLSGRSIGQTGGVEEVELTGAQNGPHQHTSDIGGNWVVNLGAPSGAFHVDTDNDDNHWQYVNITSISGDGVGHENMMPFAVVLKMIKY